MVGNFHEWFILCNPWVKSFLWKLIPRNICWPWQTNHISIWQYFQGGSLNLKQPISPPKVVWLRRVFNIHEWIVQSILESTQLHNFMQCFSHVYLLEAYNAAQNRQCKMLTVIVKLFSHPNCYCSTQLGNQVITNEPGLQILQVIIIIIKHAIHTTEQGVHIKY